jgi:hypothetical protein
MRRDMESKMALRVPGDFANKAWCVLWLRSRGFKVSLATFYRHISIGYIKADYCGKLFYPKTLMHYAACFLEIAPRPWPKID